MRIRTGGIDRNNKQNSNKTFNNLNCNSNYNTSIIDLKIFKSAAEGSSTNVLRSASVASNCSDSMQNANPIYYNMQDSSHYKSNAIFINNQSYSNRKYLIKKNLRFYDPIKDATILSQLDSVRAKLYSGNVSKVNKEPIRLEVNELPNGLSDEPKSYNRQKDETKQENESKIDEKEFKELIDYYKRSKTIDIAQIVKEPVIIESTSTQKNDDSISNNIYHDNSFEMLKKYRQKRVMSSLPLASDTVLNCKTNSNRQSKQHDKVQDNNSNKQSQANLINKYANDSLASTPRIDRSNTFVNSIRKSRKSRYDNIYKPIDVLESHFYSQHQHHKLDKTNEKQDNLSIKKNSAKTGDLEFKLSKSKSYIDELNTERVCYDPKCELNVKKTQQLIDNLANNKAVKREYPNERFQRIKEHGEYSKQKKLTSDIPNTLSTLSQVGRMSNFEKLLSNSLNNYFSQYRRLIK
jgi:hypothetical protein